MSSLSRHLRLEGADDTATILQDGDRCRGLPFLVVDRRMSAVVGRTERCDRFLVSILIHRDRSPLAGAHQEGGQLAGLVEDLDEASILVGTEKRNGLARLRDDLQL